MQLHYPSAHGQWRTCEYLIDSSGVSGVKIGFCRSIWTVFWHIPGSSGNPCEHVAAWPSGVIRQPPPLSWRGGGNFSGCVWEKEKKKLNKCIMWLCAAGPTGTSRPTGSARASWCQWKTWTTGKRGRHSRTIILDCSAMLGCLGGGGAWVRKCFQSALQLYAS